MNEEQFFKYLLDKTEAEFKKSKTFEKNGDKNWNYAICDTPIQKGKGIFFGLNWGGKDINAQTVYPKGNKDRNWNFISQSRTYFRKHLNSEIEGLNYSNLCFFRSPRIKDLESEDWNLAIPLFIEYVEYIEPKWLLMLGKPPKALSSEIEEFKSFYIPDETINTSVFGYTGKLHGKIPFGGVPHPQARVSNEARHGVWKKVTDFLKK